MKISIIANVNLRSILVANLFAYTRRFWTFYTIARHATPEARFATFVLFQ